MEPGTIVEYIDQQKIQCGIVLDRDDDRVRLLTAQHEEIYQKIRRLYHVSTLSLKLNQGRSRLVEKIKEISALRQSLAETIDILELWEVLNPLGEWVDVHTMTGLCFPNHASPDHEAAVIRAVFENRIYFKFNFDAFLPHSEHQVKINIAREQERQRQQKLVETGGDWLSRILNDPKVPDIEDREEIVRILKSYYLHGKDSPDSSIGRAIVSRAGLESPDKVFSAMVKAGEWHVHQNLELERFFIPIEFSANAVEKADRLAESPAVHGYDERRRNLTALPMITIDSQGTLDYDDALSIENEGGVYRVGVHIADVGEFVSRNDPIDQEGMRRGTSIYMPDMRISMLPPQLAEHASSLRQGEIRPAISVFFKISRSADVFDFEVVPSVIRVSRQMSYHEVDNMVESDESLSLFYEIAKNFRQKRIDDGAVMITLPEVSIRVFESGDISVRRMDRESPGRFLVSEMMIMANWLMARFLSSHNMPAVFRAQPDPKARLHNQKGEGTLFANWMQRRLLNRVILAPFPQSHSGLGLDRYLTATSPIRKYYDLVTQRQIRACFDMETPYTADEIRNILQVLAQPLSHAAYVQMQRHRYWMLRFLETKIGSKEEAIVLERRRDKYLILMTSYLLECKLPISGSFSLKPQDLVQITIQHVDARRDLLTIILG